jgi:hypothetical protein
MRKLPDAERKQHRSDNGRNWYLRNRALTIARAKTYAQEHPEQEKARHRKKRANLKVEVLTHYGPEQKLKCNWPNCKIEDIDMLTLDHIRDDGAEHRRNLSRANMAVYWYVKRNAFPDGFQTLCHNHQWKKEIMRRRGEKWV